MERSLVLDCRADKGRAAFEMIYLIVASESGKIAVHQCHPKATVEAPAQKQPKKALKAARENSFYDYQSMP